MKPTELSGICRFLHAMGKMLMHLPIQMWVGGPMFPNVSASGSVPLVNEDDVHHGFITADRSYDIGATFAVNLDALDAVEAFWQRRFIEG